MKRITYLAYPWPYATPFVELNPPPPQRITRQLPPPLSTCSFRKPSKNNKARPREESLVTAFNNAGVGFTKRNAGYQEDLNGLNLSTDSPQSPGYHLPRSCYVPEPVVFDLHHFPNKHKQSDLQHHGHIHAVSLFYP